MEKIIYENDRGESLEIVYAFPFFFQALKGQDGLSTKISKTSASGQDGSAITNVVLSDRSLRVQGAIKGKDKAEIEKFRKRLLKTFSPKVGGWLQYEYGGVNRRIRCQVETGPLFSKHSNSFRIQDFLIDILCPDPFWLDISDHAEQITSGNNLFLFPLDIADTYEFDVINLKGGEVVNTGDVECPVTIIFKGTLTSPIEVENTTTGERIVIRMSLAADERLEINTERGRVNVERTNTVTGEKSTAFQYIDIGETTFFYLARGVNNIRISAQAGETESVIIKHRNRYVGV